MTTQLEDYTIKNSPAMIPNIETPKLKKVKHKKSGKELALIRQQAYQLTMQNKDLLTICPKCDKPGYAKYRVRSSNDKLILFYHHSNEPPIGTKLYTFSNSTKGTGFNRYRECWIGNVLSESEFMSIIGKGASASVSTPPERVTAPAPKPLMPLIPPGTRRGKDLHLRMPVDLVKKIDEQRGATSTTQFILAILRDATK